MKPSYLAALLVACVVSAGCQSFSDAGSGLRERLTTRGEPKMRSFSAPPRTTYEAVRHGAARMGFRYVRGGAAQGEFEGVNKVDQGEFSGSARQVRVKVRLESNLDGGTDMHVRFSEIIEADSSSRMGMATENTMLDTPMYEVLFRFVQQALEASPAAPAADKK